MSNATLDADFLQIDRSEMASARGSVWAYLLGLSAPELYGLIPVPAERRIEILADQIGLEGGELEKSYGLSVGEKPIAIVSAIEANIWAGAKLASMYRIAGHLADDDVELFLQRFVGHEAKVEPIMEETVYFPRLATHPEARRMGAANRCMREIMEFYPKRSFSLHVHRDNQPIVAAHSKLGFQFQSDRSYEYRTMIHSARFAK